MVFIKVFDYTGGNCVAPEDGVKVYSILFSEFKRGNMVTLDFRDISVFASPFFNMAIGKLLKDFTSAELNRLLKVENLSDDGMVVLRKVIQNSTRYYSDEKLRKVQTEVIEEQVGE